MIIFVGRIHQANTVVTLVAHVLLLSLLLDSAALFTSQAGTFVREPDFFDLLRPERVLLRRDYLLCHEGMCQVGIIFSSASRLLIGGSDLTAIQRLLHDLCLIGLPEQTIYIAVIVLHEVHYGRLLLILLLFGCGVAGQAPSRRIQMTNDCLELLLPL